MRMKGTNIVEKRMNKLYNFLVKRKSLTLDDFIAITGISASNWGYYMRNLAMFEPLKIRKVAQYYPKKNKGKIGGLWRFNLIYIDTPQEIKAY